MQMTVEAERWYRRTEDAIRSSLGHVLKLS